MSQHVTPLGGAPILYKWSLIPAKRPSTILGTERRDGARIKPVQAE